MATITITAVVPEPLVNELLLESLTYELEQRLPGSKVVATAHPPAEPKPSYLLPPTPAVDVDVPANPNWQPPSPEEA